MRAVIVFAALIAIVICSQCHTTHVNSDLSCNCMAQQQCRTGVACHVTYVPDEIPPGGECTVCYPTRATPDATIVPAGPIVEFETRSVGKDEEPPRFSMKQCHCNGGQNMDGSCRMYLGSESSCRQWARTMQSAYIYGDATITYMPAGMNSDGGCTVCGIVDPCHPMQ